METVNNIFNIPTEKPKGAKAVSFSQFAMYKSCPHKWKLQYVDGHKEREESIHFIYGNAAHETIQEFLHTMYTKSVKEANYMNLPDIFTKKMLEMYGEVCARLNTHITTKAALRESITDGTKMLEWFAKHRGRYFSTKDSRLIGIETELLVPTINPKVYFVAYVDLIIEDLEDHVFKIYDIKTSRTGWKNEKKDPAKISQVLLYKNFFGEKFGIPLEQIQVEFFIVKKKIFNTDFGMTKYVQEFVPPSGPKKIKQVMSEFNEFIKDVFDDEGNYKKDIKLNPIAGDNGYNCKFCKFKDNQILCPDIERIFY